MLRTVSFWGMRSPVRALLGGGKPGRLASTLPSPICRPTPRNPALAPYPLAMSVGISLDANNPLFLEKPYEG